MVKLLREWTPAKINLFLRVTGRRGDGYHELDSVFLPVSIYDRVDLELRPARLAAVQLCCDSDAIPADGRNLAFRGAHEFLAEFSIRAEVLINLHKEIPVGAGLGGGSSDAGAVLRMMAELCGVRQSAALLAVALRLGADVPFFLNPAPARVRGIGGRIEVLGQIEKPFLLIVVPPVEVSTAQVFRSLPPEHWSGAASEHDMLAIIQGRIRREHLVNDLEQAAIAQWPQIGEIKQLLEASGARAAAMTGSGGGVFGIFDSSGDVSQARREIRRLAPHVRTFTASVLQDGGEEE
jgi:4-diphosphocytidyl-2-C-methyl-D-erythritol kinase